MRLRLRIRVGVRIRARIRVRVRVWVRCSSIITLHVFRAADTYSSKMLLNFVESCRCCSVALVLFIARTDALLAFVRSVRLLKSNKWLPVARWLSMGEDRRARGRTKIEPE